MKLKELWIQNQYILKQIKNKNNNIYNKYISQQQ